MNKEDWARVKDIFYAALELPAGERALFIVESCRGDEAMVTEVSSLFEAHDESPDFIETSAVGSVKDLVDVAKKPSRIGQTIGVYRLERQIGEGGMGSVFLGSRADDTFKKKVAVKLIKRGFDTDEIIRRFRHERQILATLEHPYITRLIDGGATDDGLPYLVMDYVRGHALTKFANSREFSINDRLELFLKICSAVSYAHQNLIIHRDLKPSNILVGDDGTPRLLDFGIAKLVAADSGTLNFDHTNTVAPAMTPEYASPEQINGMPVTTSSDIYSLGIILYELLTGYRPFRLKSKRAEEVSRIITNTSPSKPSSVCRVKGVGVTLRNPQHAIRKLQGDLDNIILMAIRKEPERRYSSVEQFAEDIRRYLAGHPVMAQEDTVAYRAAKFVKRNKAGVAAGAGVAMSLIGGLIAASRQAKIAARERDRARHEARKAEKINEFLRKMLAAADPRMAGKDVKVIEVLSIAAESVATDFVNQPEIAADLESTLGLTYLSLGQLEFAETHLGAALEKYRHAFPRTSQQVAVSLGNFGKLMQAKGDLKAAEPLYREALSILSGLNGVDLEVAEILNSLGYLYAINGESRRALSLHEDELAIKRRFLGENHVEVAKTLERIGGVLAVMDQREEAETILRRSLRIFQNVHGREHPDIALSMINLAGAVVEVDPAEANELCRASLAMRRKILGDDHIDVAWSLYNLAYVLIKTGENDEARLHLSTTLDKRGANLPNEHPVVSSCLLLLGRVLMDSGELRGARDAFEECFSLRERTLPGDHWLLASTSSFLGECLIGLGETSRGVRMMRESLLVLEDRLGRTHTQTRQAAERMKKLGIAA